MTFLRHALRWTWLIAFLALVWGARTWNWNQVFVGGQTYFEDGDCYSRMTRVQQVLAHPFQPIPFHTFENAPFGVTPHTTAPMDWLIAIFAKFSTLDFAGAFISPVLGLVLGGFLWWWGRTLPFRNALLIVFAVSPILVHGFELGRPDHQSLILLLIGVALAAELTLWNKPTRTWAIISAAAWALALWVSLFEPLILLLATLAGRLLVLGRKSFPRDHWPAAAVFAAILLFALLFDGWRFQLPSGEVRKYFGRWSQNIGELHAANFSTLFSWAGWLLALAPLLLVWQGWRTGSRQCFALAFLLVLVSALTMWNARWGYLLSLVYAFTLPWTLRAIPWGPLAWILFLASLWPVAKTWEAQLYPSQERQAEIADNLADAVELRQVANALISTESTIILAPWWLSPEIVYWSGQPCVAGSSHQSLPGIVDTARFYLSETPNQAAAILEKRHVSYVIAYEPSRILSNSSQILGEEVPPRALGKMLFYFPKRVPGFLELLVEYKYYKIYEVRHQTR